ncbi:MAG TPA: MFS transporter, partial [Thermoanaerobaculia bacterium]|nr:MFS transporter [Thermoanaerobaculia bacterium]
PPQGRRVWAIFFCMLVQGALLLLGGFEPNVPLVACALFLATLTAPIVGSSSAAIWQTKIAHEVQGRIFGLRGLLASSTVPLAFLLSGFLADQVFEPLLAPGGSLAGSVGAVIGVGPGRGIGFLYILLGLFMIAWILVAFLNPRLRNVETELPDMPRPGAGGTAAQPAAAARPATAAGGD